MTAKDAKLLRIWFYSGAFLVFLILIVGGITRLTQSGLSIVEWKPVTGIIPPLSEAGWMEEFDKYRQFPEYQQLNKGMTLSEFKFIYFWEYLHRVLARLIGMVFLIPFLWFVLKKKLNRLQFKRAFLLFGLGFAQGALGWFMVQSGLADIPYVSPYRLSAHLLLAFLIFGFCLWFGLDAAGRKSASGSGPPVLKRWIQATGILLVLQIFWGALVAGHKAGYFFNTFPQMHGSWLPPEVWHMRPAILNFLDNPVMVQWMHRVLGTLLLLTVLVMVVKVYRNPGLHNAESRLYANLFLLAIIIQYLSGVFTLLWHVPLWLGVFHQAMSMITFGILLIWYYNQIYRLEWESRIAPSPE